MKIKLVLLFQFLLTFFVGEGYSQTFSSNRDMVGHNVYFHNLDGVCLVNSKNKFVPIVDYSNYPELKQFTLYHVNRIFMDKSKTMIEIESKESGAKYYLLADGRYLFKKARDFDFWKRIAEGLNAKHPYLPSYDTLRVQLEDVDFGKLFYNAKFLDPELREEGDTYFVAEINAPDSVYQIKFTEDNCPLVFEDEVSRLKKMYLERQQELREIERKRQEKLREIEHKRLEDSIKLARIDADIMLRAPKATVRLDDDYTDHVIAYIEGDEDRPIKINKLQYVFVYDAVFKFDRQSNTEYIFLKGFNYKNDVVVCYNYGLDFNSFYRDEYSVDSHPNVLSFLKRNQGINVEERKEICRRAALEDWKVDSVRFEKEKMFFKNLQTKKICIVGEAGMMGMMVFDIYNCFNKRIVKVKFSVSDGRHSESGEYPFVVEPGNLKEGLPIGNSKIQTIQDANNNHLTSITFVFADGTSVNYAGANIKLHKKLCYDDKRGWIFD